jgi:putative hydrolase of the HAD superfamily
MKLSVKSLLFDYGGTIDTNGVHWGEVIHRAYTDCNAPVQAELFRKAYVLIEQKLGSQPLILPHFKLRELLEVKIKLQLETLGLMNPRLQNNIVNTCYDAVHYHTLRAMQTLDLLSEYYPMFLVSKFYGNLQAILREFHLTRYFRAVIESAEVGFRKPGLEIFNLALEKTGCRPEEVAVIGDSYKNDIRPAISLGCPSIWLKVKGFHESDQSVEHPFIIHDFSVLQELLL